MQMFFSSAFICACSAEYTQHPANHSPISALRLFSPTGDFTWLLPPLVFVQLLEQILLIFTWIGRISLQVLELKLITVIIMQDWSVACADFKGFLFACQFWLYVFFILGPFLCLKISFSASLHQWKIQETASKQDCYCTIIFQGHFLKPFLSFGQTSPFIAIERGKFYLDYLNTSGERYLSCPWNTHRPPKKLSAQNILVSLGCA